MPAVSVRIEITLGPSQVFQEDRLQVQRGEGGRQLDGPGGVAEVLHRLDPGDVGEEPAAAREHEHGLVLHLQEAQGPCPLG